MRVAYGTLNGIYREWICYEHKGYARQKAVQWHTMRCNFCVPETIDLALLNNEGNEFYYKNPSHITVRKEGKYDRIIAYKFEEKKDEEEVLF